MFFPFLEKITPAKTEKQGTFFLFWCCREKRGGGGAIRRAYNLVSSHHARGARDIICFENRF
jgi:hypothetical protein